MDVKIKILWIYICDRYLWNYLEYKVKNLGIKYWLNVEWNDFLDWKVINFIFMVCWLFYFNRFDCLIVFGILDYIWRYRMII